jgi:hypothetical protein
MLKTIAHGPKIKKERKKYFSIASSTVYNNNKNKQKCSASEKMDGNGHVFADSCPENFLLCLLLADGLIS